jgi:hypothetical protein
MLGGCRAFRRPRSTVTGGIATCLAIRLCARDASLRGQTPSSTESMEYETSVRPFAWPSHQPRYEAATLIRRKWSGNREFVFISGSQ